MSNTGVLWLIHCAKVSGRGGIEESLGEKGSFAEKAEYITKEALFDQRTSSKGTSGRKYHCFCKGIQMDNNFKNSEMKVTQ